METIAGSAARQWTVRLPVLDDVVDQLTTRLLAHPFLQRCANGRITLPELHRFLVQHGKYGSYFTRYLCALMSHLDDGKDVLNLAHNLAEELGYGADARIPHSSIYADMLRNFDLTANEHPIYPETQGLIDTMFMLCRQPGAAAGLGALCLGAEAVVPALYSRIMQGFTSLGIAKNQLEFFAIHIECDDDHAETMRSIMERLMSTSPSHAITIVNAGESAINARLRFFDALLKETYE